MSNQSIPITIDLAAPVTFQAELTDTFGGEANYSWVRRRTFTAPGNASDALLVRRAKAALDIQGRHTKADMGDTIELRFPGACVVCFITPKY